MSDAAPVNGAPPDLVFVIDAVDLDRLAGFWAAALHYRRARRVEQYEVLVPPEGRAPRRC